MELVPNGRPKVGHVFVAGTIRKPEQVPQRNAPCPCGSGKKYKKCCQLRGRRTTPVPRPKIKGASTQSTSQGAQDGRQGAAMAMRRAGVKPAIVFAYLKTGMFITQTNREAHNEYDLKQWDAAVAQYLEDHPKRNQMLEQAKLLMTAIKEAQEVRESITSLLWSLLRCWLTLAQDLKVEIRANPDSIEELLTTGDETVTQPVGVGDLLLTPPGPAADAVRDAYAAIDAIAEDLNVFIHVNPETIDAEEWAEDGLPPWEENDFFLRHIVTDEDYPPPKENQCNS